VFRGGGDDYNDSEEDDDNVVQKARGSVQWLSVIYWITIEIHGNYLDGILASKGQLLTAS
jgi:hypothetical protein